MQNYPTFPGFSQTSGHHAQNQLRCYGEQICLFKNRQQRWPVNSWCGSGLFSSWRRGFGWCTRPLENHHGGISARWLLVMSGPRRIHPTTAANRIVLWHLLQQRVSAKLMLWKVLRERPGISVSLRPHHAPLAERWLHPAWVMLVAAPAVMW